MSGRGVTVERVHGEYAPSLLLPPSLPSSLLLTFMFFSLINSLFFSTVPPMWISSAWMRAGVCGGRLNTGDQGQVHIRD